jgi:hypothetical protein
MYYESFQDIAQHADSEFLLTDLEEEEDCEPNDNPLGKDDILYFVVFVLQYFLLFIAQLEFETVQTLMDYLSDKERNLEAKCHRETIK